MNSIYNAIDSLGFNDVLYLSISPECQEFLVMPEKPTTLDNFYSSFSTQDISHAKLVIFQKLFEIDNQRIMLNKVQSLFEQIRSDESKIEAYFAELEVLQYVVANARWKDEISIIKPLVTFASEFERMDDIREKERLVDLIRSHKKFE